MPLFTTLKISDITLSIAFYMGVDETEYIFDCVQIDEDTNNILDLLSEEVINQIEKHIGENLDKIISYNNDGGIY